MKNKQIYKTMYLGVIALSLLIANYSAAQSISASHYQNLSYADYLNLVMTKNLEYAAEKYEVSIAKAQIEAAKVFPDPTFSISWAGNRESVAKNGYALSSGLTQTIELGGKRKARINLAKSESQLSETLLLNYLLNLRADATLNYLNALKQNNLYEVMQSSYQTMKQLADADSVRFSLGSIKAIDAEQSKIEAGVILNNLMQIEADRKESFLQLASQVSSYRQDTVFLPTGKFVKIEKLYNVQELITTALNNRSDLQAAKLEIANNRNQLTLTRKERVADIDFSIGANNTYLGGGAYAAGQSQISTGIAIPLKFSNLNKSALRIAQYKIDQSELRYKQNQTAVKNEVEQRFYQYKSLCKQVDNYKNGLLDQSKSVLNGKIYSYSRGETSLLEVLTAQHTYNDLQTSYYETLFGCSAALVELQRAVGICDIEL